MKVYKGTDKDIKCRGYQFVPGVEAVEESAELCSSGFHACLAPLDVFKYYPPSEGNRFFEAELEDVSDERHSDDTKVCGKRIKLGAEIGIPGFVKAQIEYVKANTTMEHTDPKMATAGSYGAATAGFRGAATAGPYGAATAGSRGAATSRGSVSLGKNGCGLVRGNSVKARGGIGSILVICIERDDSCEIKEWKAAVVDGETIRADTWYTLKNGEFVEVE